MKSHSLSPEEFFPKKYNYFKIILLIIFNILMLGDIKPYLRAAIPEDISRLNPIPFLYYDKPINFTADIKSQSRGPLTGTHYIGAFGDYATLKQAIDSVNILGVGTGGVTFSFDASHTELSANMIISTNTTSYTNQLKFVYYGATNRPRIYAGAGSSITTDAFVKIGGSDYITFDNIEFYDTNTVSLTNQMEWGIAVLKASGADGSQNITINNCYINLKRTNTNSIGIYSNNHTTGSTSQLTVSAFSGTNSYLKINNNTIDGAYTGISLSGYNHSSSPYNFYDHFNEIGSDAGNTVINAGGSSVISKCIHITYQDSIKINNNVVSLYGNTNSWYGIFAESGINSCAEISKNTISGITQGGATNNSFCIEVTLGASGTNNFIKIDSNIINSNNFNTATSGSLYCLDVNASIKSISISGNLINNNILPGTGVFYGIRLAGPVETAKITGNNIFNNRKTGTSGNMFLINTVSSRNYCYSNNIYNDSITSSSGTTQAMIIGYYSTSTTSVDSVYNNNIYQIGISGSNTNSLSGAFGIFSGGNCPKFIFGNNINKIFSSALRSYGIYASQGNPSYIFRNNIYNIKDSNSSGVSGGIYASGVTQNIYNNFISEVYAPISNIADALNGVNIPATSGMTANILYNTIFLDAVSTGTSFSSNGILASTNPTVYLANNVIVNNSTPGGGNASATTAAYKRSSTTLTTYSTSSNNNCFYAGTPGTYRVIFFDGTNKDQTISSFKSRVSPRDSVSVSENPSFRNTISTPYDLHIDTTAATLLESNGKIISSPLTIITDIDSENRYPNLPYPDNSLYPADAPDIGADEFAGIIIDTIGPNITYSLLNDTISHSNRILSSVYIQDNILVDTVLNKPRIYYKRNTDTNTYMGNTSTDKGWKWTQGNQDSVSKWSFIIDYSLLYGSGVSGGDTIQYFVIAQDNYPVSNVAINKGILKNKPGSVNLDYSAFPVTGTINSYNIIPSLSGIILVGNGQKFMTLTGNDGLFNEINNNSVTGNIIVKITSNITEPGTVALNQTSEKLNYRIRIIPDTAVNRTISGSCTDGLIRFNGADRVTIDGRYNNSGRYISIINNNNSGSYYAAIQLISLGSGKGSVYDTIRNCNISTGPAPGIGIYVGGSSIYSIGSDNDKNSFIDNFITQCETAIYIVGNSSSDCDSTCISGNIINLYNNNGKNSRNGMYLEGMYYPFISKNDISNINSFNSSIGINFWNKVTNAVVSGNYIHNVFSFTNYPYTTTLGIYAYQNVSGFNIYNNVIQNISGSGEYSTYDYIAGMCLYGNNHKVYFNSVNLYGAFTLLNSAKKSFALLNKSTGLDLRDNVLKNSMAGAAGSKVFAVCSYTGATFSNVDYNDYYASGEQGILGNYSGSDISSISEWRSATGKDTHSVSSNPIFNSENVLVPLSNSPLLGAGISISGYSKDFLDSTRFNPPSIGAFENSADVSGPEISYRVLSNYASLSDRVLSVIISDYTGIPLYGEFIPRIYYKKFSSGNWVSSAGLLDTGTGKGSKWSFTIQSSALGGLNIGDSIYYFVIAQDTGAPVRVSSNPEGAIASNVNNVSVKPGYPNVYKIVDSPLSGNYTVGLSDFNKITGRNIFHKDFVRKVQREIKYFKKEVLLNKRYEKSFPVEVNSVNYNNKLSYADTLNKNLENEIESEVRDVSETYSLLYENGGIYEGPNSYYVDFVSEIENGKGINSRGVYTTITAAVNDAMERGVSGPVTFYLVDTEYPSESFPVVLGNVPGATIINNITIKPAVGLNPAINCLSGTEIFKFSNAQFFVIDGSNSIGGSSKNLSLYSSGTDLPVINIINDSRQNIIKNTLITGKNQLKGLINFGSSEGFFGNDSNSVINCSISDSLNNKLLPYFGIYSSSGNYGNDHNMILNNNIYNFSYSGFYLENNSSGYWIIRGNSFYNTRSDTLISFNPINIYSGSSKYDSINFNYLGGTAPECKGNSLLCNFFKGIIVSQYSSNNPVFINGNNIKNIKVIAKQGTFIEGYFTGIKVNEGIGLIGINEGNKIGEFNSDSSILISAAKDNPITGIHLLTKGTVANNIIVNMKCDNTTQCPNILGIRTYIITYDTARIYSNKIFNIGPTSTASNYQYDLPSAGILLQSYYNFVYNNSVSIGSMTDVHNITLIGIWSARQFVGANEIIYNSIYITGKTSENSERKSFGIRKEYEYGCNFLFNNSVFADRINGKKGQSKFYAHYNKGCLFSNNNNFFVNGSDTISIFNTTEYTFGTWKSLGYDVNSVSVNPYYKSDSVLIPYLYSELIHSGMPVDSINQDIRGIQRNPTNPSIGCYENGEDTKGPDISYIKINNQTSTSNLLLNDFATISDTSGVNVTSGRKPRIYYKKINNEDYFGGNSSEVNGWKWSEAINNSSPFSFSVDYSLLYPSGTVNAGDIIQYFVVAQDLSENENSNAKPNIGFKASGVSSIKSSPLYPERYSISTAAPLSGTYNVGLNAFNKAIGKNLYFEKRSKIQKISIPVIINDEINKNNKEVPYANRNYSIAKTKEKDVISDKSALENILYKDTLMSVDYYVLFENGIPYDGVRYIPAIGNMYKSEMSGSPEITGTYATITDAFSDLNAQGVSGQVKLLLTDSLYDYETYPLKLDSVKGVSAANTITIKPAPGRNVVLSRIYSGDLIIISRTNYVTIDGSNSDEGTSKDLKLAGISSVLKIESESAIPLTNITVKNCKISGINSTYCIYTGSTGDNCNLKNITIQNNLIKNCLYAVIISGDYTSDTTLTVRNTVISGNTIDSCKIGIYVSGADSTLIVGNSVSGNRPDSEKGIKLLSVFNSSVKNNCIYTFTNSNWYIGVNGIFVSVLNSKNHSSSNLLLCNNIIFNLENKNDQYIYDFAPVGIFINGNMGSDPAKTIKLYNNSVFLHGQSYFYTKLSCAIALKNGARSKVLNNIFSNTLSYNSNTILTSLFADSDSSFIYLDYNNYYCYSMLSSNRYIAIIGENGYTNLNSFRNALPGKNLNSLNGYVDCGNSPGWFYPYSDMDFNWVINGKGMPLSEVSSDYLGNPRSIFISGGPIDIGAYEFDMTVAPPSATASGPPAPSTTTNYTQNSRPIIDITWGASDNFDKKSIEQPKQKNKSNASLRSGGSKEMSPMALPTVVEPKYISGVLPPDLPATTHKRGYGIWYLDVDANPTSPVTVTIYYGLEQLGDVSAESNLILCKYDSTTRVWVPYYQGTGDGYSVLNTTAKTISVSGITELDRSVWALTDNGAAISRLQLGLTAIVAGYYDPGTGLMNTSDRVLITLRNVASPYAVVSSDSATMSTSGAITFLSEGSLPGTNYFIVFNHRNSVETWSAAGQSFSRVTGRQTYNFTTGVSQAYGDNLKNIDGVYCIYNGDINQDGAVLTDDYDLWFNDFIAGLTGTMIASDLNGDGAVLTDDYDLWFNNFIAGVSKQVPSTLMNMRTYTKQERMQMLREAIKRNSEKKDDNR